MIVGGGLPAGGSFHTGSAGGSYHAGGGGAAGAMGSGGAFNAGAGAGAYNAGAGAGGYSAGGRFSGGTGSGGMYASGGSGAFHGGGGSFVAGGGAGPGVTYAANPGCGIGSGAADTSCCVGGPETACGGVGSACFEGAGTAITTTDWSYVGEGRGDHAQSPPYTYVGQGAGAFTKETIMTPYGCRMKPCCLIILPLLLLPLLYYLFNNSTTPAPTPAPVPMPPPMPMPAPLPPPPAPAPAGGECTIWGDPHIRTFDGGRSDYYSSGEYWIVKSPQLWMQARYLPTKMTNGLAVMKILAIGGPMLKNGKLLITPTATTWNGAPVLTAFPSSYSVPGTLTMKYDSTGALLQKGRGGLAKHIIHAKIFGGSPEGILVQVNRWTQANEGNYINAKITMKPIPGMDGHCGNYNGNAADDDRLQVRQRVGTTGVEQGPQFLFDVKTPVTTANRPDINNCPPATLNAAKADCKAKYGGFIPPMWCLQDYCFAGKAVALQG